MVDTKNYQEWFKKAESDLKGARILFEHDADFGLVCFHCQQAVEKYLKGFLIYKTGILYEGHNLVKLCQKAAKYEKDFKKFYKDCSFLNTYYVETRYPAEDPLIITLEEVEECLNIVERIKGFILEILNQEGEKGV